MKKLCIFILTAAVMLGLAACAGETHSHNYEIKVTKFGTCTEEGEKLFSCACGDSYTEKIPATGEHIYGDPTTELSCVENGKNIYTCIDCGHTLTEETAPVGHQLQGWQVYDQDLGESRNTCARCGHYESKVDEKALAMRFYQLASRLPDFSDPAQLQNIESGNRNLLYFAHMCSGKVQQHPEDMEAVTEDEIYRKNFERWITVEDLDAFTTKYLGRTYDYTGIDGLYFGSGCNECCYDEDRNAVVYIALPVGGGLWEIELVEQTYTVENDTMTIVTQLHTVDFGDDWSVTVTIQKVDGRYILTSKTTEGAIMPY